jgi:3-oxoacyl-ACP reductase-like protein
MSEKYMRDVDQTVRYLNLRSALRTEISMSKVWFVTGAGSGIGAGIAKAALSAGDRVVATGRNLEKVRGA